MLFWVKEEKFSNRPEKSVEKMIVKFLRDSS
jgi:hypothetical protein